MQPWGVLGGKLGIGWSRDQCSAEWGKGIISRSGSVLETGSVRVGFGILVGVRVKALGVKAGHMGCDVT